VAWAAVVAFLTLTANLAKAETELGSMTINMTIDGKTLPVRLASNSATETLITMLENGPITYEANDYGGFEKVGALGFSLPTSNSQITTQAGDVVLYNGNQMVLFYGSNTWSYTYLGRIEYESATELESFLKAGQGNISVKLSIDTTAVTTVKAVPVSSDEYISLSGVATKNPGHGIYIKNGKKIIR